MRQLIRICLRNIKFKLVKLTAIRHFKILNLIRQWFIHIKAQIEQKIWRRLSRRSKRVCKVTLAIILFCLVVRSLPYLAPVRASDIAQEQVALEFSDRNGLPLGTILTRDQEHTAVVPLNQVSPLFIKAILATEDARFYQHGALDLQAIARSIKEAILARKILSGASTITMQLARMLDNSPRNLSGKMREIWLAWRLTAGMNKDEIFSAYINRLPMGGNIYGLEAASRIYFSIPAADLNLAQASLLAALPNNPTYFNPYTRWLRLKQRQLYVLNRMFQEGYISRAEVERAYNEKISLQSRQQGIVAAPHFLFWLSKQENSLIQNPNSISVEARSAIQNSQIRTTIDLPLQQFVEAQVKQLIDNLAPHNVHHAAALVIDNHSGEVLAYVGSPDYFDEAQLGKNDGVQALRQPGSTLKPFLYELALEKGVIRPNTILADVPTYYAIPGAKIYSPTDYSETFLGSVRVRLALANSLNVPAVRVLEKVGVKNFLELLQQLGFTHLTKSPEYYGLGLALGSGEVSLWELARAYVTLARLGQPTPLVTSSSAKLTSQQSTVNNPKSEWALITDMLSDNHARATAFGVDSVLSLPFPSAVKTGTSSNFRDTWTVGFTTDYTVATWVGNFDGDRMQEVSGVTGAAPLWNRIMLHLHEQQEPATFSTPEGMVKRPVCAVTGLKPTNNCPSIVQEYFYSEDLNDYERNLDNSEQEVILSQTNNESLTKQNTTNFVSSNLKIVSPRSGDVFLLDESSQKSQSLNSSATTPKLEFKLANMPNQPVEWWLNNQKLATQSSNSLFWTLRPGNWTLQVKAGEITEQVSFRVQLSQKRPTIRGFSLKKNSESRNQ